MLDFLRKKKRSWVITLFLAIIVLVFVLWGVGSYVNEPRLESVAEVNGEVISQREFEVHYQRLVEFYRGLFKGTLTQETLRGLNLRGAIVEELVQKRLLLQEARRLGLEVSDEEIMEAIARAPEFQVGGRFSKNRYLQVLRSNRVSPGQFEVERRQQITVQKLYDIIQDAIQVTDAELKERYGLEQERVNYYFVRVAAGDFASQVRVTPEEIKNYYERNREALKEPLKVQVEYLPYPFDRFSPQVQVSEKEIEEFYNAHREERFRQSKAVRLRLIFFRIATGTDPRQKEQIRLKALGVLEEARAGRDFAELAKKHSEDPSAAQGGEIGWFSQGQLVGPLEKVVFSLKKGEIGLGESQAGYSIVKVQETKEEKTKSLREARGDILGTLKLERGKSEAARAADADREKALSGSELSALAKERGVPLRVTPFFSGSDPLPEVGRVEDFQKAAFSLPVKELSPVIEGPNAYYLLRVNQRREPLVPPLESARLEIEKRLKETKAMELASQKANSLLGELKKQRDIKKLAADHGLQVEETGWFVRSEPEIAKIGALQEIRPGGIPISSYQPVADRIYSQRTSLYLFAFKEGRAADMERFEKEKSQLHAQVLAAKRRMALQKFVDGLKAKAKIAVPARSLEES